MSLLVPFNQDEILAYYHCAEFFRQRQVDKQEESRVPSNGDLVDYMNGIKSWAIKSSGSDEASFIGGDDEDSSVALYSESLNILVSCFALRTVSGTTEAIFFSKKIPEKVRDNHLLISSVAISALRDIGLESKRVWLTTGEQHLSIEPAEANFEIIRRVAGMMNRGEYQVRTGRKCVFCPAKDTCTVYSEVERVLSACSTGPAFFSL